MINSMKTERVQFELWCSHCAHNVWRKRAMKSLTLSYNSFADARDGKGATEADRRCLEVFRERVERDVNSSVPEKIDTRKAIVTHKAAGRGVDLPEEVAQFLAERVTSNIRELEGAVIKVVGFAAITDQPITLSLAESCLRGMPMRRAQVTAEEVMSLITGDFAITGA